MGFGHRRLEEIVSCCHSDQDKDSDQTSPDFVEKKPFYPVNIDAGSFYSCVASFSYVCIEPPSTAKQPDKKLSLLPDNFMYTALPL